MTGASPMQLSLRELRRDGWVCDIVERRIPGQYVTHDFLGLVDIIAVRGGETLGVQCTSASNVAAHVHKVEDSPHLPLLLAAGWRVVVWGWRKKDRRWILREVVATPREDVQQYATWHNKRPAGAEAEVT